jgi:hypothetical protein
MIARAIATSVAVACLLCAPARAQRYSGADGNLRVASEVMAHQNKVPNGPSSEQLAALFEQIFSRYPKASAIGFATIPSPDEGGLAIAAVNRMIQGAVRGVKAREVRR